MDTQSINLGAITATLSLNNGAEPGELLPLLNPKFSGLVKRCNSFGYKEDYLWIMKQGQAYFFLSIINSPQQLFQQVYIAKSRPIDLSIHLNTSYRYETPNTPEHQRSVAKLFRFVGSDNGLALDIRFPLLCKLDGTTTGRSLVIDYSAADEYIQLVPYSYFSHYKLGAFSSYTRMEYISSPIDFFTHALQWEEIERKGGNAVTFIQHTLIIINIYPHFEMERPEMLEARESLDQLKKVKALLSDIQAGDDDISLRLCINPPRDYILKEFSSKDTWFLLACFHTENGLWQMPDGNSQGFFDEVLSLELKHILLMRIFHCESLISKGGRKSIVEELRSKGINRVEGSIAIEDVRVYLECLLTLFTETGFGNLIRTDAGLYQNMAQTLLDLRKRLKLI